MRERQPNGGNAAATSASPASESSVGFAPEVFAARHRDALAKLEAGYELALTDEGFRRYLTVVAKLHRYSPFNVQLIFAQRPDATMAASYRRWREMGRQVRRGERGIKVVFPYRVKEIDAETGEVVERVTGFGLGNVFDVGQTEGEPLPAPPDARLGESKLTTLYDRKASLWALGEGIRLEKRGLSGERGRWNPVYRSIAINENLPDDVARLKTLLHEIAHWQAGHDGVGLSNRAAAEVVAEGTAFAALQHWGMDAGPYSMPYIVRYADRKETIKEAMPEIARLTRAIIERVEGEAPDGETDWL